MLPCRKFALWFTGAGFIVFLVFESLQKQCVLKVTVCCWVANWERIFAEEITAELLECAEKVKLGVANFTFKTSQQSKLLSFKVKLQHEDVTSGCLLDLIKPFCSCQSDSFHHGLVWSPSHLRSHLFSMTVNQTRQKSASLELQTLISLLVSRRH